MTTPLPSLSTHAPAGSAPGPAHDHADALATALRRVLTLVKDLGTERVDHGTEGAVQDAEQVLAAWLGHRVCANALHSILVEHRDGRWVFDDPARGLVAEPFVSGADTAFDQFGAALGGVPRIRVTFSDRAFPGATITARRLRWDSGGAWYRIDPIGIDGWLCPATLKFFPVHPPVIHLQVQAG